MPARIPTGNRAAVVRVEVPQAGTTRRGRSTGDVVDAFVPSGPVWYVEIASVGGRESKQQQTSIGQATDTVTGPYRADVTVHARLVHETRILNIVDVEDRDYRHVELVVRCQAVIA